MNPSLHPPSAAPGGLRHHLPRAWSSTAFGTLELAAYAAPHIARETRRGVAFLALVALLFLGQACAFAAWFGLGSAYLHTYALLAALALHIHLSAWRVREVRALNLLAMALLIVAASALVLLARRSGQLHLMLVLSVATLLMLVPLVPWGLREALITNGSIYLMFTSLTAFSRLHFDHMELWALQITMLSAALVSLALVGRALGVRKHDLSMRFELERAHAGMALLADRDHLTGAWNRRFLERDFARVLARHAAAGAPVHFGLLDVDHFKQLNDSCGHQHGDAVLKALATAFEALDGENEYLVRLGGDEFAFLLCGFEAPLARLEAMLAAASRAAAQAGPSHAPAPSFSAGMIRLEQRRAWSLNAAYAGADALLYQAKRGGRGQVCHAGGDA